jgi:hypothetical protein
MWLAVTGRRLLQSSPYHGGDVVAKETSARNVRISAEAYRSLAVAAAMAGETKRDFASRAILEAAARVLPEGWPGAGGGAGPRPKKK